MESSFFDNATVNPATSQMSSNWMAIDWAMRGITIAGHLATVAGLHSIADELMRLHEQARRERDRA
jgi:uncharacterized membrane protein YcjF (UPF0283 family)